MSDPSDALSWRLKDADEVIFGGAVEAIQSGDRTHMDEELGDVPLQVVIHAEIASETKAFDFDSVARAISEKLIRRHPRVYADSATADTEGVLRQRDEIKKTERGGRAEPYLHRAGTESDAERFMVHNIGAGPRLEDCLFEFKVIGHYRFGPER